MFKLLVNKFRHPTLPPPNSFQGQTVLITGSNTGIGLATARQVVTLGASKLIMGVRTLAKGEAAKQDICTSTGTSPEAIEVWQVDLESFQSVKNFATRAERFINDGGRLDVAIMNAGLATGKFSQTVDGWEKTVQVNCLSTALLSLRLLPLLRRQSTQTQDQNSSGTATTTTPHVRTPRTPPHLVIVASDIHMMAKFPERYAPNILEALNDKTHWESSQAAGGPVERYAVSKLLDVYITIELAKIVSDWDKSDGSHSTPSVIVNSVTPGFTKSDLLTREQAPLYFRLFQALTGKSNEEGGKAIVDAAYKGSDTHGKWLENQAIAK